MNKDWWEKPGFGIMYQIEARKFFLLFSRIVLNFFLIHSKSLKTETFEP
jgi:hypothetical protein